MKTAAFAALAFLTALPVAAKTADWQVYERGAALELSLDRNAVWTESDGLVHFVNQERFAKPQYDKGSRLWFSIRRTTGYVDCQPRQYVLVNYELYSEDNRHVYSPPYPQPVTHWQWRTVAEGSVAETMTKLVCANPALRKKPE